MFSPTPYKAGSWNLKCPVVVVQRPLRNVQKSVMHVQSYCFANVNLIEFFLLFSLSPSLLKLHIFVNKKFCCRGNEMSYFSFFINLIPRPVRATRVRGGGLEPSANFPDKLDRWRHLRNRRELPGTRLRFFLWTFLLEPANLKIRGSRGGIFNECFEAISLLLMLDFKSPRLNLMCHMSPVIHSSKTIFIVLFQLV